MTIYYIPLKENSSQVKQLLASLGPFVNLKVNVALVVEVDDPAAAPLLERLADFRREPAAQPVLTSEPEEIRAGGLFVTCPECGKPSKSGKRCRSCAMKAARRGNKERKAARDKETASQPEPEPAPASKPTERKIGPGVKVITMPREELPHAETRLGGSRL